MNGSDLRLKTLEVNDLLSKMTADVIKRLYRESIIDGYDI